MPNIDKKRPYEYSVEVKTLSKITKKAAATLCENRSKNENDGAKLTIIRILNEVAKEYNEATPENVKQKHENVEIINVGMNPDVAHKRVRLREVRKDAKEFFTNAYSNSILDNPEEKSHNCLKEFNNLDSDYDSDNRSH